MGMGHGGIGGIHHAILPLLIREGRLCFFATYLIKSFTNSAICFISFQHNSEVDQIFTYRKFFSAQLLVSYVALVK